MLERLFFSTHSSRNINRGNIYGGGGGYTQQRLPVQKQMTE